MGVIKSKIMSLKYAILGFLSVSPLTGYDLKKAFDGSVRHFWPANQSQIYRTLAELDEQGLIDKKSIPREERLDMKVYSVTEAGLEELHRWLSTPLPPQETREPFLVQIFFGGKLSDAELLKVLQHQLLQVEQQLAGYLAIHKMLREQPPGRQSDARAVFLRVATLEFGVFGDRAYMQWLQGIIERVQAEDYSLNELQ